MLRKILIVLGVIFIFFMVFKYNTNNEHYLNFEQANIDKNIVYEKDKRYQIQYSSQDVWLEPTEEKIWIDSTIQEKEGKAIGYRLDKNDQRIETKVVDIKNNQTKYISFNVYFPNDFSSPTHWNIFAQWWQGAPASPPISFELEPGIKDFKVKVVTRSGSLKDVDTRSHFLGSLERNKWHNFIVKINVDDTGGDNGILKIWKNEEVVVDYKGELGYSDLNDHTNFRFGLYRSTNNKTIVETYFDEIKVGNSLFGVR